MLRTDLLTLDKMEDHMWEKWIKSFLLKYGGTLKRYFSQSDLIKGKKISDDYLKGGFCLALGMLWLESKKKNDDKFLDNVEKFGETTSSQIKRIMQFQAHQNVVMFNLLKKNMVGGPIKLSAVIDSPKKVITFDDLSPVKNLKDKVYSPTLEGELDLGNLFVNSYPWMDDSKIKRKNGYNVDVDRVIGNLTNHRRGWLMAHGLFYLKKKLSPSSFDMQAMMDEITSSDGFKLFDTFGKGSGHTMVCRVLSDKITYFDPNFGESEFDGPDFKKNFGSFYKEYTTKIYSDIQALYYVMTFS
jgi:hypothetical protein